MPCRDYGYDEYRDSHTRAVTARLDMLARIACKAINKIEDSGDTALLTQVLKDRETNEWYQEHKKQDLNRKKQIEKEKEKARVQKEALAKLTPEELIACGLADKRATP